MHQRETALRIALFGFGLAIIAVLATMVMANPKIDDQQLMGTVSSITATAIEIGNQTVALTPQTQYVSQAHRAIRATQIQVGDCVTAILHREGKSLLADKVKLMDLMGTGKHQKFSGKILRVGSNQFQLGENTIMFDEFTIRLGASLQTARPQDWLGTDVLVIAVKNDAEVWIAEVIRQGFEISAAVLPLRQTQYATQ